MGGGKQGAARLSGDEVRALVERRHEFVFLDIRAVREILELGSVPGHIHIPLDELPARLAEIPKGKPVVTL
jgi:rhodanese-related sulfurtransferase